MTAFYVQGTVKSVLPVLSPACHFPQSKSNYWKLWTLLPEQWSIRGGPWILSGRYGLSSLFFYFWELKSIITFRILLPVCPLDFPSSSVIKDVLPSQAPGRRGSPWWTVPRIPISISSFGSHCLQPTAAAADLCFAAICISEKLIKATN